jgi:hypothetical protein
LLPAIPVFDLRAEAQPSLAAMRAAPVRAESL